MKLIPKIYQDYILTCKDIELLYKHYHPEKTYNKNTDNKNYNSDNKSPCNIICAPLLNFNNVCIVAVYNIINNYLGTNTSKVHIKTIEPIRNNPMINLVSNISCLQDQFSLYKNINWNFAKIYKNSIIKTKLLNIPIIVIINSFATYFS